MRSRKPSGFFAPQEVRRFILPITFTSIGAMILLIVENIFSGRALEIEVIVYGCVIIAGALINNAVIVRTANFRESYGWLNAILSGIGLGLLTYVLPENLSEIAHILIVFGAVAVAIVSGRPYCYVTLLTGFALNLPYLFGVLDKPIDLLYFGMPYIVSLAIIEAILLIKDTTQQHIHRLEIINKVSRQIMLSLETEQTISILNATIQDALEADTYFVGILRENEIQFDLFYDDGDYYNGTRVPLEGTLSGWVIRNQKELFLPDLRKELDLDGVKDYVIGKERTSLSWMGVPLIAANVTGVIALGSYQPNAFDSADMGLLASLAQHITLALDNTIRHAQVEEQARLDSLTGVYNHGYFLKNWHSNRKKQFSATLPSA